MSCGSSTTRFEYPPIKQRKELRLLRIQPGTFDEPVQCEVFIEVVDWADFDAVSYTWADESGDSSECCSIFLNSTPFSVTKNCEMALKRARQRVSRSLVWIDAVCIDQRNDAERGHQVRLMPDIYSRAKTVLVYVGEGDENISWALNAIENSDPANHASVHQARLYQARLHHDRLHQSFVSLWSRRFFSRVWVLQEIALARRAVLICGDTTIPWRYIQPRHLISLGLEGLGSSSITSTSRRGSPPTFPPAVHFDHGAFTQPNRFIELLEFASKCHCKDPRDKLYSLLGLLPGGTAEGLDVDYSLSVDAVYTNAAHFLARHFSWQRVLYHASARRPEVAGLPSYVPDWSVPSSQHFDPQLARKFDAGPHLKPLRRESKHVVFLALNEPRTLSQGASEINSSSSFQLLAGMEKFHWQQLLRPCLWFSDSSGLLKWLRRKCKTTGWETLSAYPVKGQLILRDESKSSGPSQTQIPATRLKLVEADIGRLIELPERWQVIPVDRLVFYYKTVYSPGSLIELLRISFDELGSGLVIPLQTTAWKPLQIDQMDATQFSVPLKKVIGCIKKVYGGHASFRKKEMFVQDAQGGELSKMAVELLKANFTMEVREVCLV
jgi:hypothetical protein